MFQFVSPLYFLASHQLNTSDIQNSATGDVSEEDVSPTDLPVRRSKRRTAKLLNSKSDHGKRVCGPVQI